MAMIAAIQQHLQRIPRCVEVFIGQRAAAHSRGSVRNVDGSGSRRRWNRVEPAPGFSTFPKEFASSSLEAKFLSHLPGLDELPELGGIRLCCQIGRPSHPALDVRLEKRGPSVPPFVEGGNNATGRDHR